jgi:transcriptional regulator with XRE-family HTH domain
MDFVKQFERRRQELGMSRAMLAQRSRLSLPTINRLLSGHHTAPSFATVLAVAKVLGMEISAMPTAGSEEIRQRQAHDKARRLVGLVQGTCALDGQGLERREMEEMIARTARELLRSKRKLWAE